MSYQVTKLSRLFLGFFRIILFGIPVLIILQWFFNDISFVEQYLQMGLGFFDPIHLNGLDPVEIGDHHFTLAEKWLGFIGTFIGVSPILLATFVLIPLFKNYSLNHIFTLKNAKSYQRLGYIFFYDSLIANPLCQGFLTAAASLSNPVGQRQIMIGFGMINLESLFCGALIIVIARVMYMGHKLQEEQHLTV